jgi:hypothetical protein
MTPEGPLIGSGIDNTSNYRSFCCYCCDYDSTQKENHQTPNCVVTGMRIGLSEDLEPISSLFKVRFDSMYHIVVMEEKYK